MRRLSNNNRAALLRTAKATAKLLVARREGVGFKIRIPRKATITNTDGWAAVIGSLQVGRGKRVRLEVWLDRFSGQRHRKLFACFRSEVRAPILALTKRVGKDFWPIRVITSRDVEQDKALVLVQHLARSEFNVPILERYDGGRTFFGIYDRASKTEGPIDGQFQEIAAGFFEDVARSLPHAQPADNEAEVFPKIENRRLVRAHLVRERSKLLAAECKRRDAHVCQICCFHFEKAYGNVGHVFAEAHHIIPLARLRPNIETRLSDLITVCANCHRMLHKMSGERRDVSRLRSIVRRRS